MKIFYFFPFDDFIIKSIRCQHWQFVNLLIIENKLNVLKKLEKFCFNIPLNDNTGTNVTKVYNLCTESSSSFLLRDKRTLTRNGTCLFNKNILKKKEQKMYKIQKSKLPDTL